MRLATVAVMVAFILTACGGSDEASEEPEQTSTEASTTTEPSTTSTTNLAQQLEDMPAFTFPVTEAVQRFNAASFDIVTELTATERSDGVFGNEVNPDVRVLMLGPSEVDLVRVAVVIVSVDPSGQAEFPSVVLSGSLHGVSPLGYIDSFDLVDAKIAPVINPLESPVTDVEINSDVKARVVLDSEDDELIVAFAPANANLLSSMLRDL